MLKPRSGTHFPRILLPLKDDGYFIWGLIKPLFLGLRGPTVALTHHKARSSLSRRSLRCNRADNGGLEGHTQIGFP